MASVSSLGGTVGFAPQIEQGTPGTTFYRLRVLQALGGMRDITKIVEPEVGGAPIPDGAYKGGVFCQEQWDIYPRLEGDFGWMLYALTGAVSTIDDLPEAGLQTHIFRMDPTTYYTQTLIKWLTLRRVLAQPEHTNDFGIQTNDARLATAMFNFIAGSALTARLGLMGRVPLGSDDTSGWTWADYPEAFNSVPVAANTAGYVKLTDYDSGADLPTNQAQLAWVNQVTTPQDEFIIGSPYMDSIQNLYRNIQFTFVLKWTDEDFLLWLDFNEGTGASINWSCIVPNSGLDINLATCENIEGYSNPYSIRVQAPKLFVYSTAPPDFRGLDLVRLPVTGIVADPGAGIDPITISIVNEQAAYTWPSS